MTLAFREIYISYNEKIIFKGGFYYGKLFQRLLGVVQTEWRMDEETLERISGVLFHYISDWTYSLYSRAY